MNTLHIVPTKPITAHVHLRNCNPKTIERNSKHARPVAEHHMSKSEFASPQLRSSEFVIIAVSVQNPKLNTFNSCSAAPTFEFRVCTSKCSVRHTLVLNLRLHNNHLTFAFIPLWSQMCNSTYLPNPQVRTRSTKPKHCKFTIFNVERCSYKVASRRLQISNWDGKCTASWFQLQF